MTCLCKNRPECAWCGEKFDSHGLLIIHSNIKNNIPNCSQNPYVIKQDLKGQKCNCTHFFWEHSPTRCNKCNCKKFTRATIN